MTEEIIEFDLEIDMGCQVILEVDNDIETDLEIDYETTIDLEFFNTQINLSEEI